MHFLFSPRTLLNNLVIILFHCFLPLFRQLLFFFLIFKRLLEYSWFTMLCLIQVCSKVIQFYIYIYLIFLDYFSFLFFLFCFLTLQYCIGFAIYQHESTTGIHVFPILNPPPSRYLPSGSSQCCITKHPVSCTEPGLATCFIYDIIHVSMAFSQIIPFSPSPTESIRLFYTSVSLLLSHIQGYHYHLSKFHIYVLVYCIGVFLSGLLDSV